jgi:hypothetical protein
MERHGYPFLSEQRVAGLLRPADVSSFKQEIKRFSHNENFFTFHWQCAMFSFCSKEKNG